MPILSLAKSDWDFDYDYRSWLCLPEQAVGE